MYETPLPAGEHPVHPSEISRVFQPIAPQTLTWERYVSLLKAKWWIIFLTLLLAGGGAAAYIVYWPESYVSTAHMWVSGRMGLQLREGSTYSEDAQNYASTVAEMLQSLKMRDAAYQRLEAKAKNGKLSANIPTNSEDRQKFIKLNVGQVQKSAVLELRAKGPTEWMTFTFLNSLMEEFVAYKSQDRENKAQETYTSVNSQIAQQESSLKRAQAALVDYSRTNNVGVLEEQAKAASTYLTQLLAESSQLRVELQLLDAASKEGPLGQMALTNQIAVAPAPSSLAGNRAPSAAPPSEYVGAQQELEKMRIARDRLAKYLRPKHPKMLKMNESVSRAEQLVAFLSRQSHEQLENARQATKMKFDQLQQSIETWNAKVKVASEQLAGYQALKLEVDRQQRLQDNLMGLLQTVDVSRKIDQETLQILDFASAPIEGKYRFEYVVPAALILGIGAGMFLVFLVGVMDDRVLSLDELTSRFDEWVVGQVPDTTPDGKKGKLSLLQLDDKRHIFAESFRNLRSAIMFAPGKLDKPKTILVTSSVPSEGKSTVTSNLARAIAFAGQRVLLVDADMRRGVVHEKYGVNLEPGLAEFLSEGGDLAAYVQPTDVPKLSVLARGKEPANSGELILSPECDRLIAAAQKQYDCVIFDSIPIFAADDTTSLAPKMDSVLFVVRASYTSTRTVRRALQLLYERKVKISGLILNRADTSGKSYEYYKYAEYYRKK